MNSKNQSNTLEGDQQIQTNQRPRCQSYQKTLEGDQKKQKKSKIRGLGLGSGLAAAAGSLSNSRNHRKTLEGDQKNLPNQRPRCPNYKNKKMEGDQKKQNK